MRQHRFTSQQDSEKGALELDPHQEIVRIFSSKGSLLGSLSWGTLIDVIINSSPFANHQNSRKMTRAPLAIKVHYVGPNHRQSQGMTGGIGTGGLFIETASPYPVHTDLTVKFAIPTQPEHPISAKAKVSWTRGRTERLVLMPGMGIEFTTIENSTRAALTQFIKKNIEP